MTQPPLASDILIVGGGPVGLTLAIDLARRGVSFQLVEARTSALFVPKMELCNPRTMEIFRRLGIADEVRRRGYDGDAPMDVVIARSMLGGEILRLNYPSANEVTASLRLVQDGSTAREAYARISQYTLEPLLREVAEELAPNSIHFGETLTSFQQSGSEVIATIRSGDNVERQQRFRYLVGCDGASSTVRKKLGVELKSFGDGPPLAHLFFESEAYAKAIGHGVLRHYYLADALGTSIVTQDNPRFFGMHVRADKVEGWSPERIIATGLGTEVPVRIHHVGSWTPRLLIAESYGSGRVFLAGDAVHQYIPTGGFGLNTGIVDVTNLGWKLAAAVQGWAGQDLLASYGREQQAIGLRNCLASAEAAAGHGDWRALSMSSDDVVSSDDDRIRAVAEIGQRKSHEMNGIELGYSHAGSTIVAHENGEIPDSDARRYHPSTWPGSHLPHFWLGPDRSVYDELGEGFALVTTDPTAPTAQMLKQVYAALGAPFRVVAVPPSARPIIERDHVLVRPDLHVVWRGDGLPPEGIAAQSVGTLN